MMMTSSSTNINILYFVDPCSLQRGRPCQLGAEEKIRLAGSPWQDCLYKVESFKKPDITWHLTSCSVTNNLTSDIARERTVDRELEEEKKPEPEPSPEREVVKVPPVEIPIQVTQLVTWPQYSPLIGGQLWYSPLIGADQRGSEAEHGAGVAAEDEERHHEDSGHLSGGRRPLQLLSCVSVITLLCINGLSGYRDGY